MVEHSRKGISTVVIALVALVALLGASDGYLYYQMSSISTANQNYVSTHGHTNAEYNSLNSSYSSYVSGHSHTDAEYDSMKEGRDFLSDIVNLEKSQVLINQTITQEAGYYVYWNFEVEYAGHIHVVLETSNSTNNYVRATYSSHGVEYDELKSVTSSGGASFPTLPGLVKITIGNNAFESSVVKVTVILYY